MRKISNAPPDGTQQVGASDLHRTDPQRGTRVQDNVSRAFRVNDNVDGPPNTSSNIGEPSMVVIASYRSAGRTAALEQYGMKIAAGVGGGTMTSPPKTTKPTTFKPVDALDPRTDKPPGQNLQQGVQTMSYGADVADSYTSFGRRLQGSPV